WILRHIHHSDKVLTFSLGMLLLVIAFATRMNMDVILATMTMGVLLINVAPQRSKKLFEVVKQFSGPIYVIFFVLVGARLSLGSMPSWLWWIAGLYVLFRTIGKMFGAWLGAKMSHADKVVCKYTGMGLFAQGGVAVGLSIMASQHLGNLKVGPLTLGDIIIFTVTATTLAVQIAGPPAVKLAIKLADEIGRDINEEDILNANKVSDVIKGTPVTIPEHAPVADILKIFSDTSEMVLPVIKADGRLAGQISLQNLKNLFARTDCWEWLVAADVMQPATEVLKADQTLASSLELMREVGVEQILVMDESGQKTCGILDSRTVRQWLEKELIRRQTAVVAA
ncbi:MAG TPA: CBS domain-containing protein, partial [Phycisphaerae bacterium]|nr:CBS domain-containing protein [Phycisphaerae bacterium]